MQDLQSLEDHYHRIEHGWPDASLERKLGYVRDLEAIEMNVATMQDSPTTTLMRSVRQLREHIVTDSLHAQQERFLDAHPTDEKLPGELI